MFEDPIVAEIRRVRQAHAAQFNNDLDAIVADVQRRERESGRQYVSFPSRRLKSPTKTAPSPTRADKSAR
jgi:hypothetical protein